MRTVAFAATLILLAAVPAAAQSTAAMLSGTVVDQLDAVIPQVTVSVINAATNVRRQSATGDNGGFVFLQLEPGTYHLMAQRKDFAAAEVRDIVLNVHDQRFLQIKLKVATTNTMVDIVASASAVDVDPSVSTTVDRRFVQNLPLNGNSFQELIAMAPGVVRTDGAGQFSVNGQRDSTNYFTLDGVSANTAIGVSSTQNVGTAGLGSQGSGQIFTTSAVGTTSSLLSVDAIQEFKIQTSSYSAEFGRSPGAQVQITSRSGSNQYHGAAFEYFRNEKLDALNQYTKWQDRQQHLPVVRPPLRQNNFGGVFGGPLLLPGLYQGKNKTFFFVSYEGLRLRRPLSGNSPVVATADRTDPTKVAPVLQPYMTMQPLPNGVDIDGRPAYFVTFSNPSSTDSTSVRLDQVIHSKVTLFGRFGWAPSYAAVRYASAANEKDYSHYANYTGTAGATFSLSSHMVNELRANWTHHDGSYYATVDGYGGASVPTGAMYAQMFQASLGSTPQNSLFIFGFPPPTTGGNLYVFLTPAWQVGTVVANTMRQANVTDMHSWVKGTHSMKFGVDWRFLFPIAAPSGYSADIQYILAKSLLSGIADQEMIHSNDGVTVHMHQYSLYAQDRWRLARRLTLDYGLRWEFDPPPFAVGGKYLYSVQKLLDPKTATLSPTGTPLYPTNHKAFAPRLGTAYQLFTTPERETVVRSGVGVFWDTGVGGALDATNYFPHSRHFYYEPMLPTNIPNITIPSDEAGGHNWLDGPMPPPPAVSMDPPYSQQNILGYAPGYKQPFSLQWNVTVEQSLGRDQTLSAAYVGSTGHYLLRNSNYPGTNYSNRFQELYVYSSADYSSYNALQVKFVHRFSHGLQLFTNYTWSKALDSLSSDADIGATPGGLKLTGERGLSRFDLRHNFKTYFTYDIPAAAASIRPLHAILNGWSLDGGYNAHTGYPLTVTITRTDNAYTGTTSFRPDITGAPVWITNADAFGGRLLNPAAFDASFALQPNGRLQGTEPRGYIRGFAVEQLDVALRREFRVDERVRLQFRADAYNAPNQTNYAIPVTSLGSVVNGSLRSNVYFGQIQGTLGTIGNTGLGGGFYGMGGARSMQIALKMTF